MRRLPALAAAIGLAGGWLLAFAGAAHAEPTPSVRSVFQLPCRDTVCDAGSDQRLEDSDLVKGAVQVHVRATSTIGLTWVRLEIQYGDSSWVCARHWNAGSATNVSYWYDWDTTRFPGGSNDPPNGCSSSGSHGDATRNGTYSLRVTAKEAVTDDVKSSSAFKVLVNNGAAEPAWAADPAPAGDETYPHVQLQWVATADPDVMEYHYIRSGPDGQYEFAVSASRPGGQGCERSGDVYSCPDDVFPSTGYSGDYSYSLVALRASPSTSERCVLGSQSGCVRSSTSGARTASLREPEKRAIERPTPSDDPVETPGGQTRSDGGSRGASSSGGSRPRGGGSGSGQDSTYCDFYCGKYGKYLDYGRKRPVLTNPSGELPGGDEGDGGTQELAAGGSDTVAVDDSLRLLRSVAAGVVLLVLALHAGRLVRDR